MPQFFTRRSALLGALLLFPILGWLGLPSSFIGAAAGFTFAAFLFFQRHPETAPDTITVSVPGPDSDMSSMIEALPDPCVLIGKKGDILAFNTRAKALAPQIGTGAPLSFHFRTPAINDAVALALRGTSSTLEIKESVPLERWHSISAMPFADLNGETRACLILHDETPQKRSEKMRVDFIANVSHELRTPLASILGFIETLQGPARHDDKARDRFFPIIHAQATRMSRLVDDLLSLSRIEMHQHIRPNERIALRPLLDHVINALEPLALEQKIVLSFESDAASIHVHGERDELIRAFENLIENAIKYGGDGKKVDVGLRRRDDGMVAIMVRDYGAGIADHHLPRLTERFYRVDESHSREKGGTGLGLALVKHILNRHGGRLDITSRLGTGSTFTAILPEAL